METVDKHSKEFEKLERILKDIKIGMLTTISDDGELKSRPMYSQKFDADRNELWFFAAQHSEKVVDIQKNRHVHLSFADAGDKSFLSVGGEGRIVDDMDKKKELWSAPLLAWFPKGLEDPNLILICVEMKSAEYWDSSSKFTQLFGYTKAILTGTQYKVGRTEHGKIAIN